MKLSKNYKRISIYIFLTFLAFICRYYLFDGRDSWHDEWHSIYVSDPNISNTETFLRYYGDKGDYFLPEYAPPLYYFLLKFFFKIFGYIDDNGRWLSLIFGTMVIPLSMTLTKNIDDSKIYILVGFLTCFNLFLTWQSLEIRAHSMYVVNALLSIILFYKVLKNSSFINLTLYYLISLLLLSLWPITGTIFFGKTLYLIKEFFILRKKNLKILATFILIFVSYLFINFDYLTYNLARDYHYTSISKSFFYNYHFRSFFGSIILGGIFLSLFSIIFIKNLKNLVFTLKKEDVLIYIIISTYFLTLTYSFFKASIMSPKYVMFIVPLVLVWISIKIKNWNHLYAKSLLLITFIIFILNIDSSPIKRPPSKKVLNDFFNENINFIIPP